MWLVVCSTSCTVKGLKVVSFEVVAMRPCSELLLQREVQGQALIYICTYVYACNAHTHACGCMQTYTHSNYVCCREKGCLLDVARLCDDP